MQAMESLEEILTAMAGMVILPYDYFEIAYLSGGVTDGEIDTIVYKSGGSSGVTVATKTFGYDGSGNLTSVTKT